MEKRRLIVGDIHGSFDQLMDVLEKSHFDNEIDTLYSLGDFCDRGDQNVEVLRYLFSLKDFRPVLGNHDAWLQEYLNLDETNEADDNWLRNNGGYKTVREVNKLSEEEKEFFKEKLMSIPYAIVEDSFILLHGGPMKDEKYQDILKLTECKRDLKNEYNAHHVRKEIWERDYYFSAFLKNLWKSRGFKGNFDLHNEHFREIMHSYDIYFYDDELQDPIDLNGKTLIVGHTPTGEKPFICDEYSLINLDTGAGKRDWGRVTVMDVDNHKFYQSKNKVKKSDDD